MQQSLVQFITQCATLSFIPGVDVWSALQKPPVSPPGTICDIQNGKKYREMSEFTSKGNLTLVVNTDGVQLFKSSSVSMWPIWIIINELPVSMR